MQCASFTFSINIYEENCFKTEIMLHAYTIDTHVHLMLKIASQLYINLELMEVALHS